MKLLILCFLKCYKCNICNHKTTYVGKKVGDTSEGLKEYLSQHILQEKFHDRESTLQFPRQCCRGCKKSKCLKLLVLEIKIISIYFKINISYETGVVV